MSAGASFEFKDKYDSYLVYKHCDGYPSGAADSIKGALLYAWELPRFEASEFAAAFIAANKTHGGGNVYCDVKEHSSDVQYRYIITCEDGRLMVENVTDSSKESLARMLERYEADVS